MRPVRGSLSTVLTVCAPLPALILGVVAMRQLGVSTRAWSINLAATAVGMLIWALVRRLPPPSRPATRAFLTAASLIAILLPFAAAGMLGVHRWIAVAGLRLHASAIVAPLIILAVAAAASRTTALPLAIGAAGVMILALQPDAAQATSLAAACAVVLVLAPMKPVRQLLSVVVLTAVSAVSFFRHDPLPPVAHVEGIFGVVSSGGVGWAVLATVALLLLAVPFFVAWHRHRRVMALAAGVYVAMTILAPAWGTFPVPVMGFGASPILGYFLALAVGTGGPSRTDGRNDAQTRNEPRNPLAA